MIKCYWLNINYLKQNATASKNNTDLSNILHEEVYLHFCGILNCNFRWRNVNHLHGIFPSLSIWTVKCSSNLSFSSFGCDVSTGYKRNQLININDLSPEKMKLFILENVNYNRGEVLILLTSGAVFL